MRPVLGIDPGAKGALVLRWAKSVEVWDMPVLRLTVGKSQRDQLDLHALQGIVDYCAALGAEACIEDLSGRPSTILTVRNGMPARIAQKGLWAQGWNCCAPVQACVAARMRYALVTPAVWKRAVGAPSDKDGARLAATQLYPEHAHQWPLKKHDGRAEAMLIAHYWAARRKYE